jgi:dolichol-phosphate mannosyltransferase
MSVTALVVVPTYNESVNLPVLVGGLMAHEGVRVLVVDDQSPDGTGAVADRLAAEHPGRIEVLHRTGKRGFGRSYVDGLQMAIAQPVDVVCQMDADLSHDPRQLPDLLAATSHAALVVGSRYIPRGAVVNWPLRRRLLSRAANVYIRSITQITTHDCTSGYRCWRRNVLAALPIDRFISDGYSFLIEMLFMTARRGYRITEVPITFVERREGVSKVSRAVLVESAITPWRLISSAATRAKAPRS